ncbi:MAG: hypothetical protein ACJASX_000902 [Limisphaerales bacterium]|jgi:hypothetical protein
MIQLHAERENGSSDFWGIKDGTHCEKLFHDLADRELCYASNRPIGPVLSAKRSRFNPMVCA